MRASPLQLLALLLPKVAGAQQSAAPAFREFRIDAGHSQVAFAIGFLGHPVRGRFDDVKGTVVYAAGAPQASSITVAIGTESVNTGSTHRDEHLRSADFFDAAAFPRIVFQSTSVRRTPRGFVAVGPLTMHGVTREVTIPFRETAPAYKDPHGSTLVFFDGALRLARKDFGILGGSMHNDWFDAARRATMGDSVDVTLEVEAWDPDYARVHTYDGALAGIERGGAAALTTKLRALAAQHPDTLRNAEWELDQTGRALLRRGRIADALELFRLNAELFPRSAAAQASLARGYEATGDREAARTSVARALSLDPAETRAMEIRRRLR